MLAYSARLTFGMGYHDKMIRPGRRNLITDVPGLAVGNAEDHGARTGVTVILPDRRVVAAVDVRGGAPGTRDTDALDAGCLIDEVDAIVLSGGSEFGLDAASGAVAWLGARGRGLPVGAVRVPIVPAAILFDLLNGGDKDWGEEPPYRRLGGEACAAAGTDFALGNAGAGLGAKAGALKGGLGSTSAIDPVTGATIGALVAANPVGAVVMPGQATFWAWALEQADELGGQPLPSGPVGPSDPEMSTALDNAGVPGANTTIAVVATDAALTKAEARRIAIMAQDGFARAIRPAHTPFDGDTVFALATGGVPVDGDRPRALARLGAIAADTVARAVARGVFEAESLGDRPGYRAVHGIAPGRGGA
ncbi:MAG TPA: P1 family peptidase [Alphaproteobacteria bacterium]|nr:P1 family peptidase [Alphaproteobacteria bacterium]